MNSHQSQNQSDSGTVLILYLHPLKPDAPTIMEYVEAFTRHSTFNCAAWNVVYGLPQSLRAKSISAVIFHYSLFGSLPFGPPRAFRTWVRQLEVPKIGLFQDEMHFCQERFDIISELGIDSVGTLLDKEHHTLYRDNTTVQNVFKVLTGYVSESLLKFAASVDWEKWPNRPVDVGYRGRRLNFRYGKGAREKTEIAEMFKVHGQSAGLNLDISNEERDRIYGHCWYDFVASCKYALGTMSGTSIFDLDGTIHQKVDEYLRSHPNASFDEVHEAILAPFEDNVPYRAISPRLFEYAALGTAMVLFRDTYEGLLEPDVHYIPLEKDFSNIDSVLERMQDFQEVRKMRLRAHQALIASGEYAYSSLVAIIDQELVRLGCAVQETLRGPSPEIVPSSLRVAITRFRIWILRFVSAVRNRSLRVASKLQALRSSGKKI